MGYAYYVLPDGREAGYGVEAARRGLTEAWATCAATTRTGGVTSPSRAAACTSASSTSSTTIARTLTAGTTMTEPARCHAGRSGAPR